VALGNLGNAYAEANDPGRALEYYKLALIVYHELGDLLNEQTTLSNMSFVFNEMGDRDQAYVYAEAAMKVGEQIEDSASE
jgi:tetratricopeptide (TPR) repeat protein